MWLIIAGLVLSAAIAGTVYMVVSISKFGAFEAAAGGKKWLKMLLSFLVLAAAFAAVSYFMSVINAVIILLNETLFFLAFGLIMRLVRHFSGKEFTVNWQGWLALIASAVYLAVGYYLLHHVWQKDYTVHTDKNISLKIAMIADSHLGTTFDGDGFAEHLQTIAAQQPDILLIAGDFVDDSTDKADLERACAALGKLQLPYGVWYAYGNHDKGYYNSRDFSASALEYALISNGVHVLKDDCVLVDDRFYIAGRLDSSMKDRVDMNTLLSGADSGKYIIVLDHQPNDYDNEAASAADLVLSGHTHGGQLFPVTYVGEWFNINDRTYGHEKRGGTDFIVTSGISDWEILFKTGAKSEYVIISVEGNG